MDGGKRVQIPGVTEVFDEKNADFEGTFHKVPSP